jgi:hypothetical protein
MGEQHFADKKILSLGLRAAEEDSVNPIFAKPGNVIGNVHRLILRLKFRITILKI